MDNKVATFISGNKEIWDWRNLGILDRLKIACSLIFTGVVDIEWKQGVTEKYLQ